MTAYLEDYNLLLPWQAGFHAGYSITAVLLQVTKHLLTALDQGLVTELISLNTSKTLHMVHHQLLLARLRGLALTLKPVGGHIVQGPKEVGQFSIARICAQDQVLISSNQRRSLSALNVQLDGACIEQVCIYVNVSWCDDQPVTFLEQPH